MAEDQRKARLKPRYDPYWIEDFSDLKFITEDKDGNKQKLSKTAFILRQLLRVARNYETSISDLSDRKINQITGFSRVTIKKSIRELIDIGYLIDYGYHKYYIRQFERFDNGD